jgi:hypothetical protein
VDPQAHQTLLYCCLTAVSVLAACLLVAWYRGDKRLEVVETECDQRVKVAEADRDLWRDKFQALRVELAKAPESRKTVEWRVPG